METRRVNSPPAFFVVIVLLLLGLDSHFGLEYAATHVRVPNECDFLTCEAGTHVKSISDEARAPPRQRLSRYKYLAPADNVKTVILIEQCYAACFDRYLPQDSNGISKEYVLPNTATLSCMDNMEVFLCIATCAFHVNSKLPGYKANFTSKSYTDIYSPKKEIEFQLDRLKKILEIEEFKEIFDPDSTNSTIKIALKGKIAKLEGLMPVSAECKSFCNVTEYGICDTAFEGNEQNEKCKETCNYDLCTEMCDVGKNISRALTSQTETLLPMLTPAGPPHFHLRHDPQRQEVYPAAYYNISGTKPHSLDGPVGLVWKVQNVSVTSYYPFNFRHPFIGEVDRSGHHSDQYHLYTQNNHSGSGGYLNIIEFCKAANVSFAIITKRGVSSFSPPSEVCFPGVYYPSPPLNMSLNAEYDDGKLILNISLERSIDQSLIDAYELAAYLLGNESNITGRNSELFKHTFPPNQSLVLTIRGRNGIKDYNLHSIWDRKIVFKTSVLPKPKKVHQKETLFVYHLKEPQLHSPGIEYTKHFEFDNITGLLNLIVELQLITDSWNSSAEIFVNYSIYSIHYLNETIVSLDVFPNETATFSRLRPLMKEHYELNVRHSCCLMANTRYKDRFKNHSEDLKTKPIPSRLSNLTANFDIENASIVVATIEWMSSEEPYGISEFQIRISHIGISVPIADDTVKIFDNDTVQPLQKFKWKLPFPLGIGGTFNISVHAVSRWNTASESITTAIYVPTTATQASTGIPIYVWFIVAIIMVIIVSLFAIVIGIYIWYYRSNKVVVIPTSTLFVENNIFDNAEAQDQEFMPLPAMDSWEIRPQDIIVLGQLGEGNFGEVFRGLLKSRLDSPSALREDDPNRHLVVAVKLLKCDATAALKCEFFKEIDMMKKISSGSCAYIVNMVGCSTHEEPIALVLEYASNGDLLKYLRAMRKLSKDSPTEGRHTNENHYVNGPKVSEDVDHVEEDPCESDSGKNAKSWGDYRQLGELTPANLISFGWQIASGMEYLSTMHIVHRDLASRNILVCDNKQLKISDFGLAREDDCYVKTTEGKLPLRWMAIESIQERVFTTKSDVWSFGVVLWEIATLGGHPYPTLGNRSILAYLLRGMRLEKPRNCSEQWYKLTKLCWEMNPENRPHFAELRIKLGEMLNDVHHDHYIDLTVDEDMPYYRMQPADVEGDENDEVIQSFLKDDDSSYPEPSELLETSSAKHMEMILNTRQPSESSDTSASQTQEGNNIM